MIDNNSIETLQKEYLYRHYGYTVAELERLKVNFLIELRNLDEYIRKIVFKNIDSSCLITQPDIDVFDVVELKLRSTDLKLDFPEYRFCRFLSDLLYVKIDSCIYTINKNSGEIINEVKGYYYSSLRKFWTNYLVLSQELILAVYNFTDCLYKNRTIFTEGKVKDYIEQYGPE